MSITVTKRIQNIIKYFHIDELDLLKRKLNSLWTSFLRTNSYTMMDIICFFLVILVPSTTTRTHGEIQKATKFYPSLYFKGFSTFLSGQCDIRQLLLPMNAEAWLCDKPINNYRVPKNTKCRVVCSDGHDIFKGNIWMTAVFGLIFV